ADRLARRAFRAERPKPGEVKATPVPPIQTFVLANGLQVYLVEQQLPTVLMFFEWDYGTINDPRGKTGMASLCGDLMDEGTKSLDKAAFSAKQADHAVSIWTSPGDESTFIGVRALKRELGPALDLAVEMLLEPGMRESDYKRLVEQEKAWIEQSKASPSSIAYRVFDSLVWGGAHVYGKIETAKSVDAVKLDDCNKWVAKLEPEGARLWVAGKISAQEVREQLEPRFENWTGKAPKRAKIGAAKPGKGTIFFVHVDGAAQSQILVGHPGPNRDTPDYEASQLMTAIFGGSFSSRLNMNLREDKGWAYGARGGFSYSRGGSEFTAGSSVRTDATAGALREIAKEIEIMRSTAPTKEELSREQQGALLAMPANFATATRTLFSFRDLAFHDLPMDWYEGHQQRLRAVDTAAVQKAAQEHLQSSDFVVLVVGDATVVLDEVQKIADEKLFGRGGLVFLDADGMPIEPPKLAKPDSKPAAKADDKPKQ
ncbi:MAG: insulinase family protein, partial [Deltaproteobacteria bacterium]|nr:insulinase family protein [Deltaproteobacteria bacterium]